MIELKQGGSPKVFILGAKWDSERVAKWVVPYIEQLPQAVVVMIGMRKQMPAPRVAISYVFRNGSCFWLRSHPLKMSVLHELCHCLYPDWSEARVRAWVREQYQRRRGG